jgi:fructose-bisphosphate aldolase class II
MPLVTTHEIVHDAQQRGVGAGAFNVITLEHAEGIVEGAERASAPVILQISQNAVVYHHGQIGPVAAAAAAVASAAAVPVSLHLDHVTDSALLRKVADSGISSVMFDASAADYDSNVAATSAAAQWAHERGLFVEAELGEVGGKDGVHSPRARTDPGSAAAYVAATGVDALAVAVGTSHAMTSRTARIDHALIARLRRAVCVPLVLHGSSGVSEQDLGRAVAAGIVKVNIGTILNVAFTAAVREALREPGVVDPRNYLAPARSRLSTVVARTLALLTGTSWPFASAGPLTVNT